VNGSYLVITSRSNGIDLTWRGFLTGALVTYLGSNIREHLFDFGTFSLIVNWNQEEAPWNTFLTGHSSAHERLYLSSTNV